MISTMGSTMGFSFFGVFIFLFSLVTCISGLGLLIEPPSRSMAAGTPDTGVNCGGVMVQYGNNGGQCGACGDSSSDAQQQNMIGGLHYPGKIAATYENNGEFQVIVRLDPTMKGTMQFKLCPNNDFNIDVTQTCLDQNVLQLKNGGNTHVVDQAARTATIALVLPAGLTCDQCVLQWTWTTGLNAATPETFRNCADIKLTSATTTTTPPPITTTTTPPPTTTTTTPPTTTTKTTTTLSTSAWPITTTTTAWPVFTTPPQTTPLFPFTFPWETPTLKPWTTPKPLTTPKPWTTKPWFTVKPPQTTTWPWFTFRPWRTTKNPYPWFPPQTTKPWWWNPMPQWTPAPIRPRPRPQPRPLMQMHCYQFMMMCEQMSEQPFLTMLCMQTCMPMYCSCGMASKR